MKERGRIEVLWRTEKYRVLWHSHRMYDEIRELLKQDPSYKKVEQYIIKALNYTPKSNNVINSADHMWGYFKDAATTEEKEQYLSLKSKYKQQQVDSDELRLYLKALAQKYDVKYLLESRILQ
ncbi:YbgA family protein [Staphylococcus sp. SQ8-PEA]|uniref:YbgA family protein n=1 Tax=Staphylococcus marylandisciuri TaxID=2981529 RepID=A0ABT2QQM8_9STAP|nr:YbgA family protein [Staphylococcus marylandisciuri]MCU5746255.1 YbgA family protein [Staphylococcus marylandisciuri]